MTDTVSKAKRSWNMQQIRSGNTKPEKIARTSLFKMGYRFRLHVRDLPGKPDIVLPRYHTVIFVNGCFWHRHANCIEASRPKSNSKYWEEKIQRNQLRDLRNMRDLQTIGWRVIVLWECDIIKRPQDTFQNVDNLLSGRTLI